MLQEGAPVDEEEDDDDEEEDKGKKGVSGLKERNAELTLQETILKTLSFCDVCLGQGKEF